MFVFMDETDFCAVYITVMSEMNELTVSAQEDVWTLTSEDGESLGVSSVSSGTKQMERGDQPKKWASGFSAHG